ncbi:helix-turn-helix transcriptional regulator [Pedobacter endophyticus]|uniref:Helix-turn-helix transcriptional regulator n=1 Tax=Pedobacter endophyticus TaxID=2789740 RepID=A0A7S9L496_9SPHI|nr:helix-turn-helix transcriptional regulator [Pedobacter endophyticus]
MKQRIKAISLEYLYNNGDKSLAERLIKREETISRWCKNKPQPSLEDLNKIAEFLLMDIRDLLNPSDRSK